MTDIAVTLGRKSNDQPGVPEDARSVKRQDELGRAFIKKKGWRFGEAFLDDCVAGDRFGEDRPELDRLLNMVKPRPVPPGQRRRPQPQPLPKHVVVRDFDRIGRDQFHSVDVIRTLAAAGVTVWSYLDGQPIRLDSAINILITHVKAFAATDEREKTAQRTHEALAQRARAGHCPGAKTIGFDNVKQPDGHTIVQTNEAQAATVRRAFDLYLDEGLGDERIAKQLNAEHLPGPRTTWSHGTVAAMLHNERYTGTWWWNKTQKPRRAFGKMNVTARDPKEWIKVEGPCIIPRDRWQAAQDLRERRHESHGRKGKTAQFGPPDGISRKYLLTGNARCSVCGASMEVRWAWVGRIRQRFYGCSTFNRRGATACPNKQRVRVDAADEAVREEIARLLGPAFIDKVLATLTRTPEQDAEEDGVRDRLKAQIVALEKQLGRLAENLALTDNAASVAAAIRSKEEQRAALVSELEGLTVRPKRSLAETNRVTARAKANAKDWARRLRAQTPVARQVLTLCLAERITWKPETRDGQDGYLFEGEAVLWPLLTGAVFEPRALPHPPNSCC